MMDRDETPAREPQPAPGTSADDDQVRVAIEQTREALEASAAEIERAKRLLRETEELVEPPVVPEAEQARNDTGSS